MRRILLGLCVLFFLNAHGQEIPLPEKMPQDHVLEVACNGSVRER